MVCARLHLICGNCGCNDMWEWSHVPEEIYEEEGEEPEIINDEDVYISCRNCVTLHSLNDNAKRREDDD